MFPETPGAQGSGKMQSWPALKIFLNIPLADNMLDGQGGVECMITEVCTERCKGSAGWSCVHPEID